MLKECGKKVILVGNIGVPMLDKFNEIDDDTIIVAELSAHQLEKITTAPRYAVFLNLYEEHLDHYGSFAAYCEAKYQIFKCQNKDDFLFYNPFNNTLSKAISKCKKKLNLIPVSYEDYPIAFGKYNIRKEHYDVLQSKFLLGEHNMVNIAFAYNVCKLFHASTHDLIYAALHCKGLPHRLEFVARIEGVDFYNDSISTTPQSTIAAIKTLGNVDTIIIGGMDRGINYDLFALKFPKFNICNIAFVGQAGRRIKSILDEADYHCNSLISDDYEEIVLWCKNVTAKGRQCLLSPAASSYDFFHNFEHRGTIFKKLVSVNQSI
jgi:UDP-N-acetylmuramoylalanine--D-glutamate ligase